MTASKFERFQQRVFEELDELEELDRKHAVESFVEYGRQHGIDVIAEVLDKGRKISEVFVAMAESPDKRVRTKSRTQHSSAHPA